MKRLDARARWRRRSLDRNGQRNKTVPELKAAIVPVTPFQQNCTILWEEPGKPELEQSAELLIFLESRQ